MRNIAVTSAIPLNAEQKEKLEKAFEEKYGENCNLTYKIDESLIGGLIVTDDNDLYDNSLSQSLHLFRHRTKDYIGRNLAASGDLPMFWEKEIVSLADSELNAKHSGHVTGSADGIITISGLSDCMYYELLALGHNQYAIAMNLMKDCVKAVLITHGGNIEYGAAVHSTGRIVEVPVGMGLLGRVIDPLGQPLDRSNVLHFEKTVQIENPAPEIIDRGKVERPLSTGILAIDAMIPIGKGQRELIIGDRQTGKTSIAVDTIINQRGKKVICIYVAIGQRAGTVNQIVQKLTKAGAMEYTVIVFAAADDNAALQYIAPYTGCTIGEEFMAQGKDVLIVYDDLTKHANAYRAVSLLLKRPSGREAYPGDVFYIHSRLLERSAQLSKEKGGGSMTALPIIETLGGDISQYIPTNVISITDGQIYLETELFNAGIRPAINVGLSVSRVGGSAQTKGMKKLSSQLRLDLAHFREMALFLQFGADVDESTKKVIERGEKVTELLKQGDGEPMSLDEELIYLYLISNHLDSVPVDRCKDYVKAFYKYFSNTDYAGLKRIRNTGDLTKKQKEVLDNDILTFNAHYFKE